MAEQSILKVSLKEYKAAIDDLRASLLTLEKTDQEYVNTAEEIRERQTKLNEVMAVGKRQTDAIEGSYNALAQRMSEMKKEWKDLEIGTQEWIEKAKEIDEINNKLKDADASVGVFSRNVGNYGGAFEEAFKHMTDRVGGLGGKLGESAKMVKKMIPLIKQTSSVATRGLSGIKAAIATTGIGLLVVAVGELISYFSRLVDKEKEAQEAEKQRQEEVRRQIVETNRARETEISKLRELLGVATEMELEEAHRQLSKNGGTSYFENQINNLVGKLKKGEYDEKEVIRRWDILLTGVSKETVDAANTVMMAEIRAWKQEQKIEDERKKKAAADAKAQKDAADAKAQAQAQADDAARQAIINRFKDELDVLTEQYTKEIDLFKDNEEMKLLLYAEYNDKYDAIVKARQDALAKVEQDKAKKAYTSASNTKTNEANYDIAMAQATMDTSTIDGEQALADKIYDINYKLMEDKIALLFEYQKAYEKNSEEYIAINEQITELLAEQDILRAQHAKESSEISARAKEEEIAKTQEAINNSLTILDSITSIMDAASQMWEDNINQQVKEGKISEAQAKKKFEQVKGMQVAVATMQMLAGITTAIAGAFTTKTGPWDIALAAAQAAAIAASGAVNIAKIKKTSFDGNGSGGATPSIVIPAVQNELPSLVANTTGVSDTDYLKNALKDVTLEVKVTDIEAAQEKSKTRIEETSW